MDKLALYRRLLRDIILKYAAFKPSVGEIETEAIIDEANNHFELMHSGWVKDNRVHGSVLHVDIRNGKIYIQHDGTEEGIANELVEAGVPKEDIVLAFKAPEIRQHTGFAVA
ncbi:MAG: XisI protein [Gemmataceae bacterium]|nr:XisI protein [Gemmataceae bacterium]